MQLPFADFRTLENRRSRGISPELMDTVHLMRRRQAWLREDRLETDTEPVGFVGTASLSDDPAAIGQEMRRALGLMDLGLTGRDEFFDFYRDYTRKEFLKNQMKKKRGGDFYNNQNNRVGRLFASHLVRAAKEGRIGFKEAYDLTGLYGGTFQRYARKLGITLP